MMHELIDRDDPKCLYCGHACDINLDGMTILTTLQYDAEILTCRKCKEIFEIHRIDDNGETKYISFVFTCKDVVVYNRYGSGFHIGGKEVLFKNWQQNRLRNFSNFILEFPVDFSDKKVLYKKLKTYLTFS